MGAEEYRKLFNEMTEEEQARLVKALAKILRSEDESKEKTDQEDENMLQ